MAVDRTRELLAFVATLPPPAASGSRLTPATVAPPPRPGTAAYPTRSAFLRAVADVSDDLHKTATKIAELTKLAKKRSVYGDAASDIDRLAAAVKTDIHDMTMRLDMLQGYLSTRREEAGGRQGGVGAGGEVVDAVVATSQGISHGDAIVTSLKGQLMKFTTALRGALQHRTETLKAQADRRSALGFGGRDLGRPITLPAVPAAPHTPAGHTPSTSSTTPSTSLIRGNPALSAAGGDAVIAVSGPASGLRDRMHGRGGDVGGEDDPFAQLTQAQVSTEVRYLDERARDVQHIERHIADLGTLFTRLTAVVSEQGALVERIEDQVDSSQRNVERGHRQLRKLWDTVSSNRRLVLQVSGVLILFIILFVVFFL